jgi:predicted aspartyl protease
VQLQGFFPLKFIFDTGAETTIITNPRIAELLDMRYTRKFPIMGSDMETILNAYLIKSVRINFNEGVAPTQDVLVFDRDHFNLEEFIGENVQGILGADVFRNYIVVIDYNAEKLVIHKNGGFVPSKKYYNIPMTLVKNKPYINVNLAINKEQTILSKLLIDSGAALTLLLDADKEKGLDLPEQTIKGTLGYGLGGELEGYMGRIASFEIQKGIRFENLITNFRVFDSNVDSLTMKVVDQ